MKVVIAIDSFKGSLSSLQAGTAAANGIYRVDPKVETVVRPLADGGEGTVQALTEGLGGRLVSVSVTGGGRCSSLQRGKASFKRINSNHNFHHFSPDFKYFSIRHSCTFVFLS